MTLPLVSTSVQPAKLPRGTTWQILLTVMQMNGPGIAQTPVSLQGHHIICTVRKTLIDGTDDVTVPPVWQGDSGGSSSTTAWTTGAAVTLGEYFVPSAPNATGYYYTVANIGSGHTGAAEPTWPTVVGATTIADSNGVIWVCRGQINEVVPAIPSSTTGWLTGAAVTTGSYTTPTAANATGYFYKVSAAGAGNIGTTQPSWPTVLGDTTTADSNGVVWTCVGQINQATITMPGSATQVLPNPTGASTRLSYDVIDSPGDGTTWQTEMGFFQMTARVTLTEP
jgi:hypothetical protein